VKELVTIPSATAEQLALKSFSTTRYSKCLFIITGLISL
jgi:hypothetical protein